MIGHLWNIANFRKGMDTSHPSESISPMSSALARRPRQSARARHRRTAARSACATLARTRPPRYLGPRRRAGTSPNLMRRRPRSPSPRILCGYHCRNFDWIWQKIWKWYCLKIFYWMLKTCMNLRTFEKGAGADEPRIKKWHGGFVNKQVWCRPHAARKLDSSWLQIVT